MRACPGCGTKTVSGRCARCARPRRRYPMAHRLERGRWVLRVASGVVVCPRCEIAIRPNDLWDLGHQADGSPSRPEHQGCNRRAGAQTRAAATNGG